MKLPPDQNCVAVVTFFSAEIPLSDDAAVYFDRGVGLLFMTSLVLMLLTTAHFLVGAIGEKLSCEVLNNLGADIDGNSQQQELHDFVNRILPLTQLYPHGVVKDDVVTVSNIVR